MASDGKAADGVIWKHYQFPGGATYRGSFKGTRKEGMGYWYHANDSGGTDTYEGEYHDNKQHGWGAYTFGSGGKAYYGQWADGMMTGEGTYIFSADEAFIGRYENDKKHGKGLYTYSDGANKEQLWDKGELQAEETCGPTTVFEYYVKKQKHIAECESRQRNYLLPDEDETDKAVEKHFILKLESKIHKFPSGASYDGSFLGSKKHGMGAWSHPEGDEYDGEYRYNNFSGWGMYCIGKSKKKYVGGWRDGKMDGVGVYFFNASESEYFVGNYKNDQKDGIGVYRFSSGAYKTQRWLKGKLVEETEPDEAALKQHEAAKKLILEMVATKAKTWKPTPESLEPGGPSAPAAEE